MINKWRSVNMLKVIQGLRPKGCLWGCNLGECISRWSLLARDQRFIHILLMYSLYQPRGSKPANTRHSINAGLMLGERRPTLIQHCVNVSCLLGKYRIANQQTRDIDPIMNQCWSTVYDSGPTLVQPLDQCWADVLCLLERSFRSKHPSSKWIKTLKNEWSFRSPPEVVRMVRW